MNSAYIHIPFCLSKCRYCGFNSVPLPGQEEVENYCRILGSEIRCSKSQFQNLKTLYFGGGTPTVLSNCQLEGVLLSLWQRATLAAEAEVTIEANPETLDHEKLSVIRSMGFNRLSLGVQSFCDELLKFLGRPHDTRQATRAFDLARRAGFDNINLDLIYGIPGQSVKLWKEDLKKAVEMNPEHISAYSLTYEPGTEFALKKQNGQIAPCPEEEEVEMFMLTREFLETAGYQHYEVSNYAKPGYRSRHNLNYWQCGDYLGFGAGASSHQEGRRWSNVPGWRDYVQRMAEGQSPISMEEELSRDQMIFEAIFLGLRMREGIDEAEFEQRWGQRPWVYRPEAWEKLSRGGYLENKNGRIFFTIKGMMIADLLLSDFAP